MVPQPRGAGERRRHRAEGRSGTERAAAAVALRRYVDHVGAERAYRVVVEPEALRETALAVLRHHIGGGAEPEREGAAGGGRAVDADALLAAVLVVEHERVVRRREVDGEPAEEVGAAGRLDLHDVGAEVAQHAAQLGHDGTDAERDDAQPATAGGRDRRRRVAGRRVRLAKSPSSVAGRRRRTARPGGRRRQVAGKGRDRGVAQVRKAGAPEESARARLRRDRRTPRGGSTGAIGRPSRSPCATTSSRGASGQGAGGDGSQRAECGLCGGHAVDPHGAVAQAAPRITLTSVMPWPASAPSAAPEAPGRAAAARIGPARRRLRAGQQRGERAQLARRHGQHAHPAVGDGHDERRPIGIARADGRQYGKVARVVDERDAPRRQARHGRLLHRHLDGVAVPVACTGDERRQGAGHAGDRRAVVGLEARQPAWRPIREAGRPLRA